jgi:hypothetical protein
MMYWFIGVLGEDEFSKKQDIRDELYYGLTGPKLMRSESPCIRCSVKPENMISALVFKM